MATLGNDVILQIFGYLHLYDVVALIFANVLPNFTACGTQLAMPVIADFDLQVGTVYDLDGNDANDYEHTQPVIRNIKNPDQRNLPRECIIFEPELGTAIRHSYRRGQFKPVVVILRWRHLTFEWELAPDCAGPAMGDHMDVPLPNRCNIHTNDRFIVFRYWHDEDTKRTYPIKVFYKTADEKILLHCVSIPIKLLAMVLEKNCNPGDWLYSTGLLPLPAPQTVVDAIDSP